MNYSIFICVLGVWKPVLLFSPSAGDWWRLTGFSAIQIYSPVCDSVMLHMQTTVLLICIVGQKGQCCIFYLLNTFPVYVSIWKNCYTIHVQDLVKVWEHSDILHLSVLPPLILAKPLSLLKDYGVDSWPVHLNLSVQRNVSVVSHQTHWISVLSELTIILIFNIANTRQLVFFKWAFLMQNVTLPDTCLQLGTE